MKTYRDIPSRCPNQYRALSMISHPTHLGYTGIIPAAHNVAVGAVGLDDPSLVVARGVGPDGAKLDHGLLRAGDGGGEGHQHRGEDSCDATHCSGVD